MIVSILVPEETFGIISGWLFSNLEKLIICFLSAVVVFCFFACWAPLHTQRLLYVAHFIHKYKKKKFVAKIHYLETINPSLLFTLL